MTYIIFSLFTEEREVIYADDITQYTNNSNYIYENTSNIPTFPLGVITKHENNEYKIIYDLSLEFSGANLMKLIRKKRNKLLEKTDKYIMIPDFNYEYKEDLIAYRKYLRELPNIVESNILEYYDVNNKRTALIEPFKFRISLE